MYRIGGNLGSQISQSIRNLASVSQPQPLRGPLNDKIK